jgi:hypothetical protein
MDELHDVRQRGLRTAIGNASVSTAAQRVADESLAS